MQARRNREIMRMPVIDRRPPAPVRTNATAKAREISVRLERVIGQHHVEVGLLIHVPDRDYWRYVPNWADRSQWVPVWFRRPESDPDLNRLKRRLGGAIFRELVE